jgi:hypothetical protein
MRRMCYRLIGLASVAVLVLLAGCATPGPQIQTFTDQSVDFRQFQTFGFHSPLGTDRGGFQTILSQQLIASTRREMEARGFRYDPANPQLLINFGANVDHRVQVSTVPAAAPPSWGPGWHGWRRGFYQPWPTHPINETRVTQYQQGTLHIDMVNAATRQLVWEGVVTARVTQQVLRDPSAAVDSAIASAFAEFPVSRAG